VLVYDSVEQGLVMVVNVLLCCVAALLGQQHQEALTLPADMGRVVRALSLEETREKAVQHLAQWMSTSNTLEPDLISPAAIQPLVAAVTKSGVRNMAAFILGSIAQAPAGRVELISAGALPPLVKLFTAFPPTSQNGQSGQLFAAQAVGRIALDPSTHGQIVELGGMEELMQMLKQATSYKASTDDEQQAVSQKQQASISALGLLAIDETYANVQQRSGVTATLAGLLKKRAKGWAQER
jgi:hypothetical protein